MTCEFGPSPSLSATLRDWLMMTWWDDHAMMFSLNWDLWDLVKGGIWFVSSKMTTFRLTLQSWSRLGVWERHFRKTGLHDACSKAHHRSYQNTRRIVLYLNSYHSYVHNIIFPYIIWLQHTLSLKYWVEWGHDIIELFPIKCLFCPAKWNCMGHFIGILRILVVIHPPH